MKQQMLLILLIVFFSLFPKAQSKFDQEWAKKRMENRKSNDPIYEVGDTLYLFYDSTDSLQYYLVSMERVIWKLREPTPQEGEYIAESCDLCGSNPLELDCKLFAVYKNSPRILSKEDVAKLALTSRKEFMDFYLRELQRQQRKRGGINE